MPYGQPVLPCLAKNFRGSEALTIRWPDNKVVAILVGNGVVRIDGGRILDIVVGKWGGWHSFRTNCWDFAISFSYAPIIDWCIKIRIMVKSTKLVRPECQPSHFPTKMSKMRSPSIRTAPYCHQNRDLINVATLLLGFVTL